MPNDDDYDDDDSVVMFLHKHVGLTCVQSTYLLGTLFKLS